MSTTITETHIDRQATLTRDKKTFYGIIRSCAETKLAEGVSAGAENAVPKVLVRWGNGTVRTCGQAFAGIFLTTRTMFTCLFAFVGLRSHPHSFPVRVVRTTIL